jgi:hypothetical protein
LQRDRLQAELPCRCLNLVGLKHCGSIVEIGDDGQPVQPGNDIAQNFEALACKFGLLARQASYVAARPRQTCDHARTNRVYR